MLKRKMSMFVLLILLLSAILLPVQGHGSNFSAATSINVNTSIAGNISVAGEQDYFKFIAPTTGTYTIETTGSTSTYGYLYNSSQTLIAEDDYSGEGYNFRITENLTAGQTYFVKVKHFNSLRTGAYTLIVKAPLTLGEKLRNLPNNILDTMEDLGGHTLVKHVNISDADLFKRANTGTVGTKSTKYYSYDIATMAVKESISANANDIEAWLKSTSTSRKVYNVNHSFNLGYGYVKVSSSTVNKVENIKTSVIVLEKSSQHELGFIIITSYPLTQ